MFLNKIFILAPLGVLIGVFFKIDSFKTYRDQILSYFPEYASRSDSIRLFTKSELSQFTGADNSRVYLSILGDVFDVTKGRRHYGEGGGYHFFAGKDGTRAFVTGKFTEEGLVEDTTGLSYSDLLGLEEWNSFYKKGYKHIGRLIGHFYDLDGKPTDGLKDFEIRLREAKQAKLAEEDDKKTFPSCNFEYRQGVGRRIWCSNLSGGVSRDWDGVPRQYFKQGTEEPRCACVRASGPAAGASPDTPHSNRGDLDNPLMKVYDNCDPQASECSFPE